MAKKNREKVYFIQSIFGGPIKIGCTINIDKRLCDLQAGSPIKLVLLGTICGSYEEESKLHKRFGKHRIHGEWFNLSEDLYIYLKRKKIYASIKIYPEVDEGQKWRAITNKSSGHKP